MAYSTEITEEQLTKAELAKVKVGICPKCGEALEMNGIGEIKPDEDLRMMYDESAGEWMSTYDEPYIDYNFDIIECRECDAKYDAGIINYVI